MFEKSLMQCAFAGFAPILTTIEAIPEKPQKHWAFRESRFWTQ